MNGSDPNFRLCQCDAGVAGSLALEARGVNRRLHYHYLLEIIMIWRALIGAAEDLVPANDGVAEGVVRLLL